MRSARGKSQEAANNWGNAFCEAREQMKYATPEDFRTLFTEGADSLYLLSLLLTADPEKAEKCFVSGFEECANGNSVFLEWARSWARRIIIRNTIREMVSTTDVADPPLRLDSTLNNRGELPLAEQLRSFASILRLRKFERFVFVLSVLERYSDVECSLLLGASTANVQQARKQAFLHMAESDPREDCVETDSETTAPACRIKTPGAMG